MGEWIDSVEAKALIIHEQLAIAQTLANKNGANTDNIAKPYLELLRKLYQDEYAFAQLADSSDLIARFAGPAVSETAPTVTIVTSVFSDLRNQIRGIAKSIVGLSNAQRLRWPSELDPHLSGLAHGSLVVGISIPKPSEVGTSEQTILPGISDQIFESVRSAVRSLSTVARYIDDNNINEAILEEFPDPAIRDTVMVAASRLAPSGRKGIDSLSLCGSEQDDQPSILTPRSRKILNQALSKPVRIKGAGTFNGTVREIDLDARRFEIRQVQGAGTIRCVYDSTMDRFVRKILDAQIQVSGNYETLENEQPRLIGVESIEVTRPAPDQLDIELKKK